MSVTFSNGPGRAYAHEAITVDATAGGKGFTGTVVRTWDSGTAVKTVASEVLVSAETAEMRYTVDGTTVTSTVGHLLSIGDVVVIAGLSNIDNFRAIRTGGSSGALKVTFFE